MAVTVESAYADYVLQQLIARNAATSAFKPVFNDYQTLQRQCRELQVSHRSQSLFNWRRSSYRVHDKRACCEQVRCSQLDKEAGELRIENSTLHDTIQQVRSEVVSNVQVRLQSSSLHLQG